MAEGEEGRDRDDGMATAPTVAHDSEGDLRPPASRATTEVGHPSLPQPPIAGHTDGAGRIIADKYRLERELGAGGMGTVYEAQHVDLPRRYALKLLRSDRSWDPLAVQRFRREAQEAAAIEHPGIVDVVDFGQTSDGEVYLVMELLVGEPVDALLRRGPVSFARAVDIAIDVLDALDAAHRHGLVHRDIKPENLFSTRDADGSEQVKILDFGIAKVTRDDPQLTREGVFIGTPSYMSLEQMQDSADVDRRADIYSVGATLHHLLTGAPPVEGATVSSVMSKVIADQVTRDPRERRPDTPDWLAEIVVRALARDVGERFESARAMGDALRDGRGELADASAPPPVAGGTDSRRPSGSLSSSGGSTVIEDVSTADTIDMDSVASSRSAAARTAHHSEPAPAEPSLTAAELDRRRQLEQLRWIGSGALAFGVLLSVYVFWPTAEPSPPPPRLSAEPSASAPVPTAEPSADAEEPPVPDGMVVIEGGASSMGSDEAALEEARGWCESLAEGERLGASCDKLERETPAHEVSLAPFALDEREVDNQSFATWLNERDELSVEDSEGGRIVVDDEIPLALIDAAVAGLTQREGRFVPASDRAAAATSYITWYGARRYCHARGKRLPTEAEWERAARGTTGRAFAWGNERPACPDAVFARLDGAACADMRPQAPMPSGASPRDRTPEGVLALAGNVREWVADPFAERYASCADSPCPDPGRGADDQEQAVPRVIRGGGWAQPALLLRAARRAQDDPDWADPSVGFRCAMDLAR